MLGFLLFGEKVGVEALIGIVLIIGASAAATMLERRKTRKSASSAG